ncbi:MAG: acyl-[ACP]--phospholipid O-acyltransferase [Gammaproteobacteria bacterium]
MHNLSLLKQRYFLPLFLTQFFGACNDNVFKNALVILITYRLTQSSAHAQILVTLAAGFFILPFWLFSALAGQLADKYEKSRLMVYIKLAEIILMVLGAIGFYTQDIALLMGVLFFLGVQATFFGPLKYAILPYHLPENSLLAGNALIETGTFLAILFGTILGGALILTSHGVTWICLITLGMALVGWWSSFYIPRAAAADPHLTVGINIMTQTAAIMRYTYQTRDLFLAIIGISWFWLVGAVFLSQFPTYGKQTLHADGQIVTLFLTLFSIGIGIGSLACSRLLKGRITANYVPLAALGMTIFMLDLYSASKAFPGSTTGALLSLGQFLNLAGSFRILLDLLLVAVCGGFYIVPLYTLLQIHSAPQHRSRVIASNNVMNALFMVIAAVATIVLLEIGFSVLQVFFWTAIVNGLMVIYACKLVNYQAVKGVVRQLLKLFYRVEVHGLSHFLAAQNDRLLIIANHTSLLDPPLIAAFLPKKIVFAINTQIANQWWMRPILKLVDLYKVDSNNPMASKALIERIKKDNPCMVFPEGRITVTGALMKVYEGPGMIADKADAAILPIRIAGAQYSPFSYLKGKVRIRWFPKITLTILPPRRLVLPEALKGRTRRAAAGLKLYDLMTEMLFASSRSHSTLFSALFTASQVHGARHRIAEDIQRKPITYRQFILRCFILGHKLTRISRPQEKLGVLLPNSIAAAVTFFAMQAVNRIPTLLNFSAGTRNILTACATAKLTTVITAKSFITTAKLSGLIEALQAQSIHVVYLEELAESISRFDQLRGLLRYCLPYSTTTHPDDPAVVLFTSGSENTPKGVVLSHQNIQANDQQLSSCVDFGPTDRIFNALPMFHAFGLTCGTLLPLISGIKVFFYPSPLQYRRVPELVYDTNSTILFGTDTFLAGYAHYAHHYDFYSIHYVFAGGEKLKASTYQKWLDRFGIRVLEGYGATETAPILAVNTSMHHKKGTVGRFLPGIQHQLKPVPGLATGKQLWVNGPNVMLGYLTAENPDVLQPLHGFYDTGDIVQIDAEGYITILGRAKRFAKIAGEMVSLAAVESYLSQLWPNALHAVISKPSAKGEQLVLVTEYPQANRPEMMHYAKQHGISELWVPKVVSIVEKLPLLSVGKVDYLRLQGIGICAQATL